VVNHFPQRQYAATQQHVRFIAFIAISVIYNVSDLLGWPSTKRKGMHAPRAQGVQK